MRYFIDGLEIRSENAAKSHTQFSVPVYSYFLEIKNNPSILDFGCGKLRYSDVLVTVSSKVTFVDSKIQLIRDQMVRGLKTSVIEYVKNFYSGCKVVCYEDLDFHKSKYDLITCTNVWSAIPCERTLIDVVSHMRRLVKKSGKVVIINQYRNASFKKFQNGKPILNGFLYSGGRGDSYYGIYDIETTKKLLLDNGFSILNAWNVGEVSFVEAKLCT